MSLTRAVAAVAAAAMVIGCSTTDHADRLAALNGAGAAEARAALGEPTRVDTVSDGRQLWTYYRTGKRGVHDGPGASVLGGTPPWDMPRATVFVCVTTLRFDVQGRIEATDFDGEHC